MKQQKLIYRLSQTQNRGYDTYDSCIVCAYTEEEARNISPSYHSWGDSFSSWCWCRSPEDVQVECIGKAKPSLEIGVVLASFNAG